MKEIFLVSNNFNGLSVFKGSLVQDTYFLRFTDYYGTGDEDELSCCRCNYNIFTRAGRDAYIPLQLVRV